MYAKVGCPPDCFDVITEPLCNTIFFAGEHTSPRTYGTVHSAYFSGIREAARIMGDQDLFRYGTEMTH
jgi:hypothetical protein